MASTYNYTNGQIERDFHFVRWDEKCKRGGLPAKAGNDWCRRCPHYVGSVHPWSFGPENWCRLDDSYVMCNHPDAKDSEDSSTVIHLFNEKLKHNALCALCY